jgi:hypothetical protein
MPSRRLSGGQILHRRRKEMRKLVALLIPALLIAAACEETTETVGPEDLNPPLGLYSVTGDSSVALGWYTSNFEDDLDGYFVYVYEGVYADSESQMDIPTGFVKVDSLGVASPSSDEIVVTLTGLENGQTYSFLVVAAKDDWMDISYTSNIIIDTPRPEVASLTLKNQNLDQTDCALKFSSSAPHVEVVDYDDPDAALMFESFDAGAGARSGLVGVRGGGQVQDLGFMSDWDIADVAPVEGYPDSDFSVTARAGHVYAAKVSGTTVNYAKIWVSGIAGDPADNTDVATVWVAYQTDPNNPEYSPAE